MAFSLAPLLVYSDAVPAVAREALRAANAAPAEHRRSALASAARVLYTETALDCDDALEIVGLQRDCGCD
jgi:alkylation response protein AidB-like acyl-CoA dehydrogenase